MFVPWRDGRALEQLVAILETALSAVPVEVRSPDYIRGSKSKSMREIDVSLRATVGSATILVVVECRDREGRQDVNWIEQIVGKRDDVGANQAVAVARDGFTSGATNYAEQNGVLLRTIEEVDLEQPF